MKKTKTIYLIKSKDIGYLEDNLENLIEELNIILNKIPKEYRSNSQIEINRSSDDDYYQVYSIYYTKDLTEEEIKEENERTKNSTIRNIESRINSFQKEISTLTKEVENLRRS